MAHHKRQRTKNQRAGCLMCKPNKMNGWNKARAEVLHQGFGPIRDRAHAEADLRGNKGEDGSNGKSLPEALCPVCGCDMEDYEEKVECTNPWCPTRTEFRYPPFP